MVRISVPEFKVSGENVFDFVEDFQVDLDQGRIQLKIGQSREIGV
jgi:hypothetical protein